jgi:hypothetical protein
MDRQMKRQRVRQMTRQIIDGQTDGQTTSGYVVINFTKIRNNYRQRVALEQGQCIHVILARVHAIVEV